MSRWMDSGASRLKQRQNRSFAVRAKQNSSASAAMTSVATAALASSAVGSAGRGGGGGAGRRKRGLRRREALVIAPGYSPSRSNHDEVFPDDDGSGYHQLGDCRDDPSAQRHHQPSSLPHRRFRNDSAVKNLRRRTTLGAAAVTAGLSPTCIVATTVERGVAGDGNGLQFVRPYTPSTAMASCLDPSMASHEPSAHREEHHLVGSQSIHQQQQQHRRYPFAAKYGNITDGCDDDPISSEYLNDGDFYGGYGVTESPAHHPSGGGIAQFGSNRGQQQKEEEEDWVASFNVPSDDSRREGRGQVENDGEDPLPLFAKYSEAPVVACSSALDSQQQSIPGIQRFKRSSLPISSELELTGSLKQDSGHVDGLAVEEYSSNPITRRSQANELHASSPADCCAKDNLPPRKMRLRYFNNGVEVDESGVQPHLKPERKRTLEGKAACDKSSPVPSAHNEKPPLSVSPPLPRSCSVSDVISYAVRRVPELSKIENGVPVDTSSGAGKASIDGVLQKLYRIASQIKRNVSPKANADCKTLKDLELYQTRVSSTIRAIEAYKRGIENVDKRAKKKHKKGSKGSDKMKVTEVKSAANEKVKRRNRSPSPGPHTHLMAKLFP